MRQLALFLFLVLSLATSACSAVDWVFGSSEPEPNTGDPAAVNNQPANDNLIPSRPAGEGAPYRSAVDNNNPIPVRPWEARFNGNPDEPATTLSRDSGLELLQYLNSVSVKDSTPPWYNRTERSISETVEDINMHYKRLLPPLNPGR